MANFFDLTGMVALVTTAEKGIGPCQALGLAEAGADVVVTGQILYVNGGVTTW